MEEDETEGEVDTVSPAAPISDIVLSSQPALGSDPGEWFVERSKYIPLRLTLVERKYLRLLEAALQVSEYTDKIDTLGFGLSKAKRIVHQIRELCAILSGLVLAADYKQGQELFTDRDFASNADFYQKVFELGRRHKIMNPDKMRTTYGKLVYLLQVSFSSCERHGACALLMPFCRTVSRRKCATCSGSRASRRLGRCMNFSLNITCSTCFVTLSLQPPRRRSLPISGAGGRSSATSRPKNARSSRSPPSTAGNRGSRGRACVRRCTASGTTTRSCARTATRATG